METPKPLKVAFQSDAIQSHFGEGNRDSHLLEPEGTAESHGMKVDYSPENPNRLAQRIRRTLDRQARLVHHVNIDHRRPHVFVAQQFLHCPDIRPVLQ